MIDPRISYGASSARKTGTTVDAPPTASPSMIRPVTRIAKPGEKTATSTPTKNSTASTMIVLRRPMASEIFPPTQGADRGGEDQRADDDAHLQVIPEGAGPVNPLFL